MSSKIFYILLVVGVYILQLIWSCSSPIHDNWCM